MVRTYTQEKELFQLIEDQEKDMRNEATQEPDLAELDEMLSLDSFAAEEKNITADAIEELMNRSSIPDKEVDEDMIM